MKKIKMMMKIFKKGNNVIMKMKIINKDNNHKLKMIIKINN